MKNYGFLLRTCIVLPAQDDFILRNFFDRFWQRQLCVENVCDSLSLSFPPVRDTDRLAKAFVKTDRTIHFVESVVKLLGPLLPTYLPHLQPGPTSIKLENVIIIQTARFTFVP